MDIEKAREYCIAKKGCEEGFPFDEDTLVFKVMGKMFAVLMLEKPDMIVLKCDACRAEELRDKYTAVEPAWHFNKKYWNQVRFNADVDDGLIFRLIDHSLDEVVKKFTRKMKAEYESM